MIFSKLLLFCLLTACGPGSQMEDASSPPAENDLLVEVTYDFESDFLNLHFRNNSEAIINLDTCFIVQDLDHIIQNNNSRIAILTTMGGDEDRYYPQWVDPVEPSCEKKYVELKPAQVYVKKLGFSPFKKDAYILKRNINHFVVELALNYFNRTTQQLVLQKKMAFPFETKVP